MFLIWLVERLIGLREAYIYRYTRVSGNFVEYYVELGKGVLSCMYCIWVMVFD